MAKYVLDGWIRAKLTYFSSNNLVTDPYEFYLSNNSRFNLGGEKQSKRIKTLEFKDDQENVVYSITFAYDEIGISFSLQSVDGKDSISIFESLLGKAIDGYKRFKEHFQIKMCPKNIKTEFSWQGLMISLYGFLKNLSVEQQNDFLKKVRSLLMKYSSNVQFSVLNRKLEASLNKQNEVRLLSLAEYIEQERFDFGTIILAIGDETYLYVDHHLFANSFFVDDLSVSLQTVAKWGFISSLFLSDFSYENKKYQVEVGKLRKELDEAQKKRMPFGLDIQQENLTRLERTGASLEDDIAESMNLSDKIYEGINKSENAEELSCVLGTMRSLPHSLDIAYGVLTVSRLGMFSHYRKTLEHLRADLNLLESKFKKLELYTMGSLLIALFALISIANYWAQGKLNAEISYIADILQILTFVVAFTILASRLFHRH